MPSTSRRALLASAGGLLAALSGCASLVSPPPVRGATYDPHWVKVYLTDRERSHDTTVTVRNADREVVYKRKYQLSDANEEDEDGTFPDWAEPETVVVTVDGTRFERGWPGFEQPELPCGDANEAGIEVYVVDREDGKPAIRLEADCQSVRREG